MELEPKDKGSFWQIIFALKEDNTEPLSKRLGRALSLAENSVFLPESFSNELNIHYNRPHIFVLVGPSGVGKSVLVDRLLPYFLNDFKSIAILATDPTSTVSGGALLGDRVRISNENIDSRVFYRSVASRGSNKSYSDSIPDMIQVLSIFEVEVVLVESMGVAQQDVSSSLIADTLVNVLSPSAGDEIQIYKSGILEFGDIFFINKVDIHNSDSVFNLLQMKVNKGEGNQKTDFPKVIRGSATERLGIKDLYFSMLSHLNNVNPLGFED